jgi:hypothetical protein
MLLGALPMKWHNKFSLATAATYAPHYVCAPVSTFAAAAAAAAAAAGTRWTALSSWLVLMRAR